MNVPNETWDLDTLAEYVLTGLAKVALRERKIRQLNRRTAVETHRIGFALALAREKTKPVGRWGKWLKKHGIPTTTAWEAIKLYGAASEEEVGAMTISEAKARYGIYPEFMPDEADKQTDVARDMGSQDPGYQLALMHRRLKTVAETINSIEWQKDLLWSVEVDELLKFCKAVLKTVTKQRDRVRQPKRENTRRYLEKLRSL